MAADDAVTVDSNGVDQVKLPIEKFQKLSLANQARLMVDNQKTLDLVNKRAERYQRHEAGTILGLDEVANMKDEDEDHGDPMNINIDSPTTHTTNHISPEKRDEAMDWKKAVMNSILTPSVAGLASAALVGMLQKKPKMPLLHKVLIGASLASGIGGLGLGTAALLRDSSKVIEKVIPGTDTETTITPGELTFE